MGTCCFILHGIALILVLPLCSSFLLFGTVSDLACLVCDEVHDLADCEFGEKRCRPNEACYLEVRGDIYYQRIKAGCGSLPTHCFNHHGKRGDHDFCDYPVLCNGDCRDSDSCNEKICDLPLYGHYEPTTTVKTIPTTTETATVSNTVKHITSSGSTAQVSTTQKLPTVTVTTVTPTPKQPISTSGTTKTVTMSFGSSTNIDVSTAASTPAVTVTTATPTPKQPITSSGITKTVTTPSILDSSTNSDVSTTTKSAPTATVTTTTPPSSKQPITSSGTTETVTSATDGSSTNNVSTTNATVPPTTSSTGVMCATCSGPMCGYSPIQPQVQCSGAAPYCMNSVVNHLDASRTITKACATVENCKSKWWHQTSDRSECTGLNIAVPVNDEFTCHFCCTKDDCNKPVVPATDSLFRG